MADRAGAAGPVRLGTLEQQVMDLLWSRGPLTTTGLVEHLDGPAYTTVATVVGNLGRKQLLESERVGRTVVHRPTSTREQHTARQMASSLATSQDRAASILHFADALSEDEADLLRAYLDRRSAPS